MNAKATATTLNRASPPVGSIEQRAPLMPRAHLFEQLDQEVVSAAIVDGEEGSVVAPDAGVQLATKAAFVGVGFLREVLRYQAAVGAKDDVLEIRVQTRRGVEVLRPLDPAGSRVLHVALDARQGRHLDLTYLRVRMAELAFGVRSPLAADHPALP